MDLRQIRHFLAVADELHFGRAADRLNMTQPPLSMSIRRLEEDLGVQLFHRTTKSVTLTTVGAILRRHATQVMSDFDQLPTIARQAARGELGTLRLSFVSIASFDLLPRLVSRFRQAFPQVQLDLQEATSDVQLEALMEGRIDAGIIIRPSAALHPRFSSRTLRRDTLLAAVSDRWAPAASLASGTLDFRSIADAPLIFFPRPFAPAYYDAVEAHYADHGRPLQVHQEAIQMQTIIGLVAAGLGISLVPRSMVEARQTGVHYLEIAGRAPQVDVCMIWKRDADQPALHAFLDIIED